MTAKTIGRSHFPATIMVRAGICANGKRRWSSSKEMSKSMPPAISNKFSAAYWSSGRRSHSAHMDSRFNKTGCRRIRPTRQSPSAKSCFPALGARMFGRPTRRISTRRTTRVDYPGRKSLVYSIRHSGAAENDGALTRAWGENTVEQCATIIGNFRKRLRKYIVAKGGNFENML